MTFHVLVAVAGSSPSANDVTPGVLGFLVFAAIAVALVFLLRSMNKQFRKITPKAGPAPADLVGGEGAKDGAGAQE